MGDRFWPMPLHVVTIPVQTCRAGHGRLPSTGTFTHAGGRRLRPLVIVHAKTARVLRGLNLEVHIHELITALVRAIDTLPMELVLCTPAGSILHTNLHAQKRLGAGGDRKGLEAEIRFLCVVLHLQIAEGLEQEGTEGVPQVERRVMLDGREIHLRAMDLGVPRDGRGPTTLVLIDSPDDPLSDRRLEQLGLTRAEIRIARLVTQGKTNREVAQSLGVSVHTVRHHVQHILDKVGVRSRTRLMATFSTHRKEIAAP